MSRDRIIQLQECAEELGYSTIQEAIDNGYHEVQDLVSGTFTLKHTDAINAEGVAREQEKAHEAWLKEKGDIIRELQLAKDYMISTAGKVPYQARYIERAITFLGRVSHE